MIKVLKFWSASFIDHHFFGGFYYSSWGLWLGPRASLVDNVVGWTRICHILLTTLDTFSQRAMKLSVLTKLISTGKQAHKVAQLVVQHQDNTRVAGPAWSVSKFGAYRIYNLPPLGKFWGRERQRNRAKHAPLLPCPLKPTKPMWKKITFLNLCKWNKRGLVVPAPFMDF